MADEPTPYTEDELRDALPEHSLDGWEVRDGLLRREYSTDGWPTTLMLVNAIGFACQAAFHHADLAVSYDSVGVALRTHSADALTAMDLAMAQRIEETALWQPGSDSPLGGNPDEFVSG